MPGRTSAATDGRRDDEGAADDLPTPCNPTGGHDGIDASRTNSSVHRHRLLQSGAASLPWDDAYR